jgi:hypothetical protein
MVGCRRLGQVGYHRTVLQYEESVGAMEGCIKEGAFYAKVVRKVEGQEVGATDICNGEGHVAQG